MEFLKLKSSLEACFFIKRAVLTQYLFLQIVSNKWEQKHLQPYMLIIQML